MARQHSHREGCLDSADFAFANRVWGTGGWVLHEDCPAATAALGSPAAVLHSRGFHGGRPPMAEPRSETGPHEHVWRFVRTDEDWWDGDETEVYECAVEGCDARDRRYIPR